MTVKESFNSEVMPKCVEFWVENVIDKTEQRRRTLGNLLCALVNKGLLQKRQCIQGFGKFLQEQAIELKCDIPKLWDNFGQIVGKYNIKNVQ